MSSNLIAFEGSLLECSCCAAAALAAAGNNIAKSRREYFMFILEVKYSRRDLAMLLRVFHVHPRSKISKQTAGCADRTRLQSFRTKTNSGCWDSCRCSK